LADASVVEVVFFLVVVEADAVPVPDFLVAADFFVVDSVVLAAVVVAVSFF
jgi:hypothetical protein